MSDYPSAVTSFATVVDGVDDVLADPQNQQSEEIVAIQSTLGVNPQGSSATVAARLNAIDSGGWIAASGTWSYSSADSPTFVISVNANMTSVLSVGMRIKLTQTTAKYFIVTAVGSYSGSATLITVYGGKDYTLANAAITSPYYSSVYAPLGFPVSPEKWTVSLVDTSDRTQATPTQNVWYNLGSLSISIPIGVWRVGYRVSTEAIYNTSGSALAVSVRSTLSTANNSASDSAFISDMLSTLPVLAAAYVRGDLGREKLLALTSKTTYYLNGLTNQASGTSLTFKNSLLSAIVNCECAYL
jgi:hypothetical protein